MDNIENRIVNNINSLIMVLVSKGIKKISLPKLVLFINREFNIQMDDNNLSDILSKNNSVASIDGDTIVFGSKDEDEELDDDIHDTAVQQAGDNLTNESLNMNLKMFENIHIGDMIMSKNVILNEDNKDYFLHMGAKKNNAVYIVSEIFPKMNINESYVRCKIKGESLFIDVPLNCIKKTEK